MLRTGLEHTKHTGGSLDLSLAPLKDLKALVLCKLVLGVSEVVPVEPWSQSRLSTLMPT